jgi:hypothetical protein
LGVRLERLVEVVAGFGGGGAFGERRLPLLLPFPVVVVGSGENEMLAGVALLAEGAVGSARDRLERAQAVLDRDNGEVDEQGGGGLDGFWVLNQTSIHPPTVREYIHEQSRCGELVKWCVVVRGAAHPTDALGHENLGIVSRGPAGLINRSRLKSDPTSLGVITDPGDELYGLKSDDIEKAQEQAANRDYPTLGKAYRSKRSPQEGLLLIYPISANSIPGKNAKNRIQLFADGEDRHTVLGYAISFPFSDSPATVTYVQGPESRRK